MKNLTARRLAGIFLLAILLAGCAAPQTRRLLNEPSPVLPKKFELAGVPFFAQEAYQCGPASLAMVLNAAGINVQPESLTDQVYIPARQGSVQVEMLAAARRNGALAYELAPQLNDLLTEVAAGNPVLAMQNLAFNWYPKWHYAVVVGYDLPRQEIILRSGLEVRQILPIATFERTWARSGYWSMLALPPEKMPATASEVNYIKAVTALEKNAKKKLTHNAYLAALNRWPDNLVALMGAGNAAHTVGDLVGAEAFFRETIARHPDAGDAWNNLAQTLADMGRHHEALYAVKKAIPLGGPQLEIYRKTQSGIELALPGLR